MPCSLMYIDERYQELRRRVSASVDSVDTRKDERAKARAAVSSTRGFECHCRISHG